MLLSQLTPPIPRLRGYWDPDVSVVAVSLSLGLEPREGDQVLHTPLDAGACVYPEWFLGAFL